MTQMTRSQVAWARAIIKRRQLKEWNEFRRMEIKLLELRVWGLQQEMKKMNLLTKRLDRIIKS